MTLPSGRLATLPAGSGAYLGIPSPARRCYSMELVRSPHSLGEANFHLQFTPKYRRDVFRDGEVKKACEESFRETAARYGFAIHAIEFGPDHAHIFVGATTNEAIRFYLEHSQRKHWKAVDHDIYLQSKQKPITEYIT
jgi:hypothetical protein